MFQRHNKATCLPSFLLTACLAVVAGCNSREQADTTTQQQPSQPTPMSLPATPANLHAGPGNSQVSLTWSSASGATQYHVKRATYSGGPYEQLASATSTGYTDSSVANGTAYYYVVSSVNDAGESGDSVQASATPAAPTPPPPAVQPPSVPTDVVASSGDAQITVSWSASNGAASYQVSRGTTSGGPYMQIAAPTSTSYVDMSVTNGTPYYYVVSAVNSAGESANSAQVSATPAQPINNPPPVTFGTWSNVTPSGVNLGSGPSCGNYGTETVQVDPSRPSNLYTEFNCQGIWRSTDYGATWTGPINTGTNGATVSDCAGGITVGTGGTGGNPIIYEACIRGSATGFWKSVDGGVNWTRYVVAPSGTGRQDYYPAVIDPYDQNHLLMAGHEMDYLVESVDGGQTWTNVSIASGMLENGGTGSIFFINTGSASTTRKTWLWMAQQSGGTYGTWRTSNNGASWVQVDKNEHPHGSSQIYQPDHTGVVYMAGAYSNLGWGVLRSTDYGQTWTHFGNSVNETVVFGTSKNVYAMFGYPIGAGGTTDPTLETAAQPGTGSWVQPGTPAGLTQGAAQIAVINDGTHNIIVGAMWNSGIWRYIEP